MFRSVSVSVSRVKRLSRLDARGGYVLRAGVGRGFLATGTLSVEQNKGVRWMPWRQKAMKDVARCEKPRGDASDR
jgi:hypothetical protein